MDLFQTELAPRMDLIFAVDSKLSDRDGVGEALALLCLDALRARLVAAQAPRIMADQQRVLTWIDHVAVRFLPRGSFKKPNAFLLCICLS